MDDGSDSEQEQEEDLVNLEEVKAILGISDLGEVIRDAGVRILLMGGNPGQLSELAQQVGEHYSVRHFSSSDIILDEIEAESTVGKSMQKAFHALQDVDDDIVVPLMADKIFNRATHQPSDSSRPETFVLTGFPRNAAQATRFQNIWTDIRETTNNAAREERGAGDSDAQDPLQGNSLDFVVHVLFDTRALEEKHLDRYGNLAVHFRYNEHCKFIEVPLALMDAAQQGVGGGGPGWEERARTKMQEEKNKNEQGEQKHQATKPQPKTTLLEATTRLIDAAWLVLALEHTEAGSHLARGLRSSLRLSANTTDKK